MADTEQDGPMPMVFSPETYRAEVARRKAAEARVEELEGDIDSIWRVCNAHLGSDHGMDADTPARAMQMVLEAATEEAISNGIRAVEEAEQLRANVATLKEQLSAAEQARDHQSGRVIRLAELAEENEQLKKQVAEAERAVARERSIAEDNDRSYCIARDSLESTREELHEVSRRLSRADAERAAMRAALHEYCLDMVARARPEDSRRIRDIMDAAPAEPPAAAQPVARGPEVDEICGDEDGRFSCQLSPGHSGPHVCPDDDLSKPVHEWPLRGRCKEYRAGDRCYRDRQHSGACIFELPAAPPPALQGSPECAVCRGDGRITYGTGYPSDEGGEMVDEKDCDACGGTGRALQGSRDEPELPSDWKREQKGEYRHGSFYLRLSRGGVWFSSGNDDEGPCCATSVPLNVLRLLLADAGYAPQRTPVEQRPVGKPPYANECSACGWPNCLCQRTPVVGPGDREHLSVIAKRLEEICDPKNGGDINLDDAGKSVLNLASELHDIAASAGPTGEPTRPSHECADARQEHEWFEERVKLWSSPPLAEKGSTE